LALALSTFLLTEADFVTGVAAVLPVPAASAGTARTEAASSAAEIVFNMVLSSFEKDHGGSGRVAGLFDLAFKVNRRALNPP
jgi:hypothetical protein